MKPSLNQTSQSGGGPPRVVNSQETIGDKALFSKGKTIAFIVPTPNFQQGTRARGPDTRFAPGPHARMDAPQSAALSLKPYCFLGESVYNLKIEKLDQSVEPDSLPGLGQAERGGEGGETG